MSQVGGTLWKYFEDGGFFMWPILLLSVISVVVTLERLWVFMRSGMPAAAFVEETRTLLGTSTKQAIANCDRYQGPVASVIKAGLLKFDAGGRKEEINKTMENFAIHEIAKLERGLPVLASVANIAPLIGFLGTVAGMVDSFDVIATQGLEDPSAVARGISVALLTTAFGLIVALMAQPAYNYFTVRVASFIRDIETSANFLIEVLDALSQDDERTTQIKSGGSKH